MEHTPDGDVPESPREGRRREAQERAARQELRAAQAIRAIMSGGDLSAETLNLSNEFTDETTARITRRLTRGRDGARGAGSAPESV